MSATRILDLTERMIYLRAIPVAAMLSPPVLKIVANQLRERQFREGEVLMREGGPISTLELLTEGSVTLVRKGIALGTLAAPQSLGLLGILARSEGTYDATAERETRTLTLDADEFIELLEEHPELLRATLQYLAERILHEMQESSSETLTSRLEGEGPPLPEGRELDLVERIVWVRSRGAYTHANVNAVASMAKQFTQARYVAGEALWSLGAPADSSFWVLWGRISCVDALGKRWLAGPGSVLGGLEAIAGRRRWYGLTAETAVVGLKSPIASYLDLLDDDFALAQGFLATLAAQLIGLIEESVARGKSSIGVLRDVTRLSSVPVGA